MNRYIDADSAYKVLTEYYHQRTDVQHLALKEALDRVQTAEVVDVVRCKDCFYGTPFNERWTLPKKNNCMWCRRYEDVRTPEWFCADGERREDDKKRS